jgi:uncharacterized Zn finger protein
MLAICDNCGAEKEMTVLSKNDNLVRLWCDGCGHEWEEEDDTDEDRSE